MVSAGDDGRDESAEVEALRRLVMRLPQSGRADARLVETHLSLLLLTGDDAYKFKKPVHLPFADFRDAAKRARLCRAEVRLNRRLAACLYLGVVAVTGSEHRPRLGGRGRALAHAVHMRRFASGDEAGAALADGRLDGVALAAFGQRLAVFHEASEALPEGCPLARPADLDRAWRDDLAALRPLARGRRGERLRALADAWPPVFEARRRTLAGRRRNGRVRACHGDLHLGNLVLLRGRLTAFDCIEFNDEFRYVDVVNELAFLFMDLHRHRRAELAVSFLDGYLAQSGDYAGLDLLRLFAAYRASVRAKIAGLRLAQQPPAAERAAVRAELDRCIVLASGFLAPPPRPRLVLTHGVSGSGKSHLAGRLATGAGWLRIRSDVVRRRLYDVDREAGRRRAYAPAGIRATYRALRQQARHALVAGLDVVADATFGDVEQRRPFLALAAELGVPVAIVDLRAPPAVLESRVVERAAAGLDASQADLAVLRRQLARATPLTSAERVLRVSVDGVAPVDAARLDRRIRRVAALPPAGFD